ncbi:hypothetical protein ACQP2F_22485 [Actinoplanes sp. CA-030573]|uniref:hypothetical protein n=1 Tax=Actinoplanes sp. CA-030573 TaxID=3239898 RepID=UPI003D906E72
MSTQRVVHITVSDGDDERTDEVARRLLTDLREFDEVTGTALAGDGSAPDGAKGGELVAIGGLVATVLSQPEAVTAVLKFLTDRVVRRGGRLQVRVDGQELTLENATPEQMDRVVDAFVRKVFDTDS